MEKYSLESWNDRQNTKKKINSVQSIIILIFTIAHVVLK